MFRCECENTTGKANGGTDFSPLDGCTQRGGDAEVSKVTSNPIGYGTFGAKTFDPMPQHTNRLAAETSPYLLQHQHNPVDWYPWGEEAFARAEAENKLVLVSVGYSACHWCHVMEHETFENEEAAAYMNQHFVNIKVDREERPDVDQVYMTAVQLMTQRGGWPLNCFTLADGRPIYGGTYFPKHKWLDVLRLLVNLQQNDPSKLYSYAEELTYAVGLHEQVTAATESSPLPPDQTRALTADWKQHWDRHRGGLGHAPKFPMPNNWQFLLEHGVQHDDTDAQTHAHRTLQAIIRGGMADQIGGGYARYSVDAYWKVPHFEKMLYDNGQLLGVFALAYAHNPLEEYERAIRQTVSWLERDLKHADGWWLSALDADSEGVEGKHYTWIESDLKALWGSDFDWASNYYNVNKHGFWEHGQYIPLRTISDVEFAENNGWSLDELHAKVDDLRARTLRERGNRVFPGLDDKVILSWNALTVLGLSKASQILDEEAYGHRAVQVGELLWKIWEERGYLPHVLHHATIGFLEDHAATAQAFLELYRQTQNESWVLRTEQLLTQTWNDFHNPEGMPWYTANSGEKLVSRKQENFDNVTPAASSMLAHACLDLGTLLGNTEWTSRAEQLMRNMLPELRSVQNTSNWCLLLDRLTRERYHVCVSGTGAEQAVQALNQGFYPGILVSLVGENTQLPTLLGKQTDDLTFYTCIEGACQRPVHSLQEVLEQIS